MPKIPWRLEILTSPKITNIATANTNPNAFALADKAITSSFIPIKKIRIIANKKYCKLGKDSKLEYSVNDNINPIKIPIPPNVGINLECDDRSFGLTTSPLYIAILIVMGNTIEEIIKAVKNDDIILI